MEMVLLIYDADFDEDVMEILSQSSVRGFTKWERVVGRGERSDPRLGNSVWPGYNSAILVAVDEDTQNRLIGALKRLHAQLGSKSIKIFTWSVKEVL